MTHQKSDVQDKAIDVISNMAVLIEHDQCLAARTELQMSIEQYGVQILPEIVHVLIHAYVSKTLALGGPGVSVEFNS